MTLHLKQKLFNLLLLLLPIFCVFVFSDNTFAVSDWSADLQYGNTQLIGICHNTNPNSSLSGHACTDYNYIIFTTENDFTSVGAAPYFTFGDHNSLQANSLNDTVVFAIPANLNISVFTTNASSLPSGWKVTVTLSENFPGASCPPCPEPDPCPECDCDDAFIVGLFKDSFWNVATAIVSLIVPVLALFLLFRLVHGLMFGKGL